LTLRDLMQPATHTKDLTDVEYRLFRKVLQEFRELDPVAQEHVCAALSQEVKRSSRPVASWPAFKVNEDPLRRW
jgi:hypothetical protein